jgi:hypothetical protein
MMMTSEKALYGAVRTIAEWLASIGLAEYTQCFAENCIGPSVLPDLTDEDLRELGLPLGHRKKMLRAIAELREASAKAQMAAEPEARDRAERRQLTVMFCDLVGSTALSARRVLPRRNADKAIGCWCDRQLRADHRDPPA